MVKYFDFVVDTRDDREAFCEPVEDADGEYVDRTDYDAACARIAVLYEALKELESATSDTLRSHPETACCSVTRNACIKARAALLKASPDKSMEQV